jgi:long-chain acyl-CoA synthetase
MSASLSDHLDAFIERGHEIVFAQRMGLRTARWSYEQLARTAYQIARELDERGIGKQDRVLLWAESTPVWVAIFFGCVLRGAIVVPVDLHSDSPFVAQVQEQVTAKLAICDTQTALLIDINMPVVTLDEIVQLSARHSPERYAATAIDTDDMVEILFTSGTTAEPKGVRITHRNLLANLMPLEQEIKPYLKWERLVHPLRFLNLVPLSHVFGQFMGMFVPQLIGGEVHFQESLNPTQIIETVKRDRISVVVAVPRILGILRERIERTYEARDGLDQFRKTFEESEKKHFILRWWRFRRVHRMFGWKFWAFISGGATLDAETEIFWQRLGFAVIQGYGMTETAALISVNHPLKATRRSIGKILPGAELKLAENGEILVRGQNVSPGYWGGHAFAEDEADGWFHTGDIAEVDAEGNLYFKGREKEVIVTSAGVNIYPEDIERVLDRHPEIKASTIIETQTATGPEPLAVLILREERVNPNELINRVNESLAQHQRIRHWFIWPNEDFPRTATQKIRKQMVIGRVKAEMAGAVPSAAISDGHRLAEIISRISKEIPSTVIPSAKLGTDLKLDSLGRVELLSALEDRYQVEIDEAAFTDSTTLADVEKIIREGKQEEHAPYPYPRWQQRWPVSWLRIALLHAIVFTTIRTMGWPKIRGKERLRNLSGPVVLVCNHVTMVDHAVVLFALPTRFKTKMVIAQDGEILREWRHPPDGAGLLRRVLNLLEYFLVVLFFNVFSMPQKSGFRRSFAFAGEMMDRGYNLMIFPEGERTKHGAMNPFRVGTGLLIRELDAPVVPMRIDGLWKLKQANRHFAWPGEISVVFGEPVRYSNQDGPEKIALDLSQRVKSL